MKCLITFSVCLALVAAAPQPNVNDDNLYLKPYEHDDDLYDQNLRRKLQSVSLKLEDRDDDDDDEGPQLLLQRKDQFGQDKNFRNLQQALQRAQHQAQQQQSLQQQSLQQQSLQQQGLLQQALQQQDQRLDDDDDDVLKEQQSAAVQMMALAKNLDKLQRQYNGQGVLRVQYQPSPIVNTYPALKAYNLGALHFKYLAPNDNSLQAVNSQRQSKPVGRSYYRVVDEEDDDDHSYRKK